MLSSSKLSARFLLATAITASAAMLNATPAAESPAPTSSGTPANQNVKTGPGTTAKTVIAIPLPAINNAAILKAGKFIELRQVLLENSLRTDLTVAGLNKAAVENLPAAIRKARIAEVLLDAVKTKKAEPGILSLVDDEITVEDLQKALEESKSKPEAFEYIKAELTKPAKPLTSGEQLDYALEAMFSSVTPHDDYMPAKQADRMNDAMSANFVGIGVQLSTEDGQLKVLEVFPNSPAAKAGVKAGDILTKADDTDLTQMDPSDAIDKHLRGVAGSKFKLTLQRDQQTLTLPIKRAAVQQKSVEYTMLEGGIAHFHIKHFNDGVSQQLRDRIAEAKADARLDPVLAARGGLKGVILNFMYDPGGSLPEARQMADDFIDKEGFVVTTEGRDISHNEILRSTKGDILNGLPMVVLVNERSASASELVPNALQDHGRAIVMGTPTYGKGTVQVYQRLDDGTSIKYTIAQFIRPSGASNQLVGTIPDIQIDTKNPEYEAARLKTKTERSYPNAIRNDHGQTEQANRTKKVCSPANDHDYVAPEAARLKGLFNQEGKLNPFLACARDYLLQQADASYVPTLTVTKPYTRPATPAVTPPSGPAALRPNS